MNIKSVVNLNMQKTLGTQFKQINLDLFNKINLGGFYYNRIRHCKDLNSKTNNPIKKAIYTSHLHFAKHNFKKIVKCINSIKEAINFLLSINSEHANFVYDDLKFKKKYDIVKSFIKLSYYKNNEADIYVSFNKRINMQYKYSVYIHQNSKIGRISNATLTIINNKSTKNYFVSLDELDKMDESKYFLNIIKKAIVKFSE